MPRVEANGGVKDIVGIFPGVLNEKRKDNRDALENWRCADPAGGEADEHSPRQGHHGKTEADYNLGVDATNEIWPPDQRVRCESEDERHH